MHVTEPNADLISHQNAAIDDKLKLMLPQSSHHQGIA
jgi:hypothetical protein